MMFSELKREVEEVKGELEGLQIEYAEEIILIKKRLDELTERIRRLEKLYNEALVAATKIALKKEAQP